MAVFTKVTTADAERFLEQYNLGKLTSIHGIAEGVENSNFLIQVDDVNYILTLFEGRSDVASLPYFIDLMQHVHQHDIACPKPIAATDGTILQQLNNRHAVISSFLQGTSITNIDAMHCKQLGKFLGLFHKATQSFSQKRKNHMGLEQWKALLETCSHKVSESERSFILDELLFANEYSLLSLPLGTVHADLYPDNLFFQANRISGIIDFYFSCYEVLLWDIAICINGWCFKNNTIDLHLAGEIVNNYNNERSLTENERSHLSNICRLAALRIYATRLYDWHFGDNTKMVGKKDPDEPKQQILYYRQNQLPVEEWLL